MNSMTGYGRGAASADGREVTVELKSVNHRYLDVGLRLPRHLTFLEDTLRTILSQQLSRGHVDIFVNYRNTRSDARSVQVDAALLQAYTAAARSANEALQLPDDLTLATVLRMPGVTEIMEAEEDQQAVIDLVSQATQEAVVQLKQMRAREGARLHQDLNARLDTIADLRDRISQRAPLVVEEYKVKLDERIAKLAGNVEVDQARLATEVAIFADKASIDEEITRLASHITEMRAAMEGEEAVGRRLDFIVQEMNREFNTIGSKANDGELTKMVLGGKNEIEKIREQVQNIE